MAKIIISSEISGNVLNALMENIMSEISSIEWTDATWNPVRGCSRVSDGCNNCYAERMASRFSGLGLYSEGFAKLVHGKPHWTGKVAVIEKMLERPSRWRKGRRIFVNSMSDLFHESLSDADINRVFDVMRRCPRHTFQILTKRAEHMRDYLENLDDGTDWWPLSNIHIGVSVENEDAATERIPALLETPAAVRWISYEPALGPVNWERWLPEIDWLVCGGESGPGSRPMQLGWARAARDACKAAGVAFFFKQWGNWIPDGNGGMKKVGKKKAGNVLDGKKHENFPTDKGSK